ncbi:MAG TPA: hypothetical protein VJP08_00145, partial [Actinomycetota bacterium]|nr:hypothetical protein [Actinomycetota bacterium]
MAQTQSTPRRRDASMDEDVWRRRGRWLKRILIIYGVYLAISYIFLGIDPITASSNPGVMLANLRPFLLQAIVLMSFIVIQFVALFWFLARGTT